ncbi:MAG: peptidoglycan-binding domain-containing protein [Bacteroidota bacterium]
MKRLLLVLAIILCGIVGYFQYQDYKRFNPPSDYLYPVSNEIDINYFDQLVVQQYYDNAYELAAYGREKWANEGIDVRYPTNDETSQRASDYYNKKLSITNKLQDLLVYSADLKKKGFNNQQIKEIIESGLSPTTYIILQNTQFIGLKKGDQSNEVWEIQKMFIDLGYEIPKDGKFGPETEAAVIDYQNKNNLFESGAINEITLRTLLKVK